MARTDWKNDDIVKAQDMNAIGEEINNLRTDIDNIPDASLTEKGIVQLTNDTNSTSETLAPTAKALKNTYDLANGKQDNLNNTRQIELGQSASGSGPAYIDFHSGAVVTDFDARIIVEGGNGSNGGAPIRFLASDWIFEFVDDVISIKDLKSSVSNGKTDIASAIIDKGGSASGSDTFAQLAAAIRGLKGNVAMGYFDHASTSNLSITESVSGLSFTPRYVFMRIDTVATPGNKTRFLGLISNQPPFNFVIGLGARADLSSFIPAVGGFTVTVNFSITDSGITQLVSQFHEWIAVE